MRLNDTTNEKRCKYILYMPTYVYVYIHIYIYILCIHIYMCVYAYSTDSSPRTIQDSRHGLLSSTLLSLEGGDILFVGVVGSNTEHTRQA